MVIMTVPHYSSKHLCEAFSCYKDTNVIKQFRNMLVTVFNILCFVAAFVMTYRCLVTYLRDDDVCIIDFKSFHQTADNVYPSISICISNIFVEEKLKNYDSSLNISAYTHFLNGNLWMDKMANVDYDNISINLRDFVKGIRVIPQDEKVFRNQNTTQEVIHHDSTSIYVSFRASLAKCFTFDTPFNEKMKVMRAEISFNSSLFPNGTRPTKMIPGLTGFGVSLHYPKHMTRSFATSRYNWPERKMDGNYVMEFSVRSMEVVRYRNKLNDPCITDWQHFDDNVLTQIIKDVGCKPPHLRYFDAEAPECTTKGQMQEINRSWMKVMSQGYWNHKPCTIINQLQFGYEEIDDPSSPWITVAVDFRGTKDT